MATVKIGYPSTDSYVAFAEESTFGTAIADGSNFTILNTIDNNIPSFDPESFLDDNIRNQGKNVVDINDFYSTENGLWKSYPIPQFLANSTSLKHMLYAACQTVSEGATGPYLATYAMNGLTKPDFSTNAGYFFTLLAKSPMASFSQKLTSCVLQDMNINISPEQGGRMLVSGTAITGKGYTGTSNPSGTNAIDATAIPNFHDSDASTLQINSVDCVWYGADLNIVNQFDFTGYNSGNAENYTLISQEVTGNIIVKYDANTDTFLNAKNTSLDQVDLTIGASDSAGYFRFLCEDSWLMSVEADRGGTDTVQKLNLGFKFANDYANADSVTFYCADNVDATW